MVKIKKTIILSAHDNGDIQKLIAPVDSEGRRCGHDESVKNKPFLLFFDLTKCAKFRMSKRCPTTQICVKECPKKNFFHHNATKNMDFKELKSMLICTDDVDIDEVKKLSEIDELIRHERCAEWYMDSVSILERCFPRNPGQYWDLGKFNDELLKRAEKFIMALHNLEATIKKVSEDIRSSR